MDDDENEEAEEEGSVSSVSEPPSDNEKDEKEDMQADKVTDEVSLFNLKLKLILNCFTLVSALSRCAHSSKPLIQIY